MKQLVASILVSLILMYLAIAFISLTPNIVEWEVGGRGAYLFFGALLGIVGYSIKYEVDKNK